VVDGGRILIGGTPLAIVRLSASGAGLVRSWFGGTPLSQRHQHRMLARRLIDNGMAHPRRPPPSDTDGSAATATATGSAAGSVTGSGAPDRGATVVVPVKDDEDGLAATLDGLTGPSAGVGGVEPWAGPIVVVDDGSAKPVDDVNPAVSTVRRTTAGGPAVARQDGLNRVDTPLVAFVDAGVSIDRSVLAELVEVFDDPDVVAVAPRVRSTEGPGLLARYERRRSPLDLGPVESPVGPGRRVSYLPTACLVARTDAVRQVGGFDPALRFGEDVDLVWRLSAVGAVRYRPDLHVTHPPRPNLSSFLNQRRSYGSAAGPLAVRHGDAVAPARLSGWSFLPALLATLGRPASAVATTLGTGLMLRSKVKPMPDATIESMLMTARGHWYGSLGLLNALPRTWLPPVLAVATMFGSTRGRLAGLLVAAVARRLLDGPRDPVEAAVDVGLGALDDAAYCVGVWQGSLTAGTTVPLLPVFVRWPNRRQATDR
jgi:mycofactocin system glycosyltransferase